MTPEQALQQIQAAGKCFVIFDADTGEVLEVHQRGAADTSVALIGAIGPAAERHGAVKGRFFDGATVTLQTLEDEVGESRRVAARVAMFSRWAVLPPGDLVHILETSDFAPPMDAFHGSEFTIERLFDYPPDVLRPLIPRLERLARHTLVERGIEEFVLLRLESRLAVLAGDFAGLKATWERAYPDMFSGLVWHGVLLECIGDLRSRDADVIEILIQTVSYPEPMMFYHRGEALRSLGKVGAPAGARAAQGIRAAIHDSEPWIIELRERVLSRIETPETAWQSCPRCYWGKVPGRPFEAPNHCADCLGLGLVPHAT